MVTTQVHILSETTDNNAVNYEIFKPREDEIKMSLAFVLYRVYLDDNPRYVIAHQIRQIKIRCARFPCGNAK